MTGGTVTDTPKRNPLSRPVLAVVVFVVILGIGALLRWAADGPTRPEFWPVIIALAIGLGVFTYFRPLPYLSYNEKPVESPGTALFWAIVWGAVEAGIFWVIYYLAYANGRYWGIALMMGVLGATNRYFHGRHLRKRHRAQILAIGVVILLLIAAKYAARH
jgi:hypothetical protein